MALLLCACSSENTGNGANAAGNANSAGSGASGSGTSGSGASGSGIELDGGNGANQFPESSCSLDLAKQFSKIDIPVEINAQQDQSVPVVVAPDATGGVWLAWTDSPWSEDTLHAHIRHFDSELNAIEGDLDLPGSVVLGMYAHADGSLAIAHGRRTGAEPESADWNGSPKAPAANTLYLSNYMGAKKIFETKIQGGEGYTKDPESTWLLADGTGAAVSVAYNGSEYALYYVIGKHFASDEVHQADEFIRVASDGSIVKDSRLSWLNSHGFWPSATSLDGEFYTLISADPFPTKTLVLGSYEGTTEKRVSVWPPADVLSQVQLSGPSGRAAAIFSVGGKLASTVRTWIDIKEPAKAQSSTQHTALFVVDQDGTAFSNVSLEATSEVENDLAVLGARFGTQILTLVGKGSNASVFGTSPVQARVYSVDGVPQGEPVELDARMAWSSDPVTLKDGSVVWPAVKDNVSKTVQLARIGCR